MQELEDGAQPLLKVLGKADGERLAKAIAESGGSVTLTPSVPPPSTHVHHTSEDSKSLNGERFARFKRRGFVHTRRPHTHGMLALGEGYISLVRRLMDPKVAPRWAELTNKAIYGALLRIPDLAQHLGVTPVTLSGEKFEVALRGLASLAVLGGLPDVLHQGGRALVKEQDNTDAGVTVVEYTYGADSASVVMDTDPYKALQRIEIAHLTPIPDVPVDPSLFVLTPEILPSFMSLFLRPSNESATPTNPKPEDASPFQSSEWLIAKLKSSSLKALDKLLTNKQSAETFFRADWESYLKHLKQCTQTCTNSQIEVLESKITTLGERLWELTPPVDTLSSDSALLSSTLTYSPHSKFADRLPTSFARSRVGGFVLRGHDKRTVEFSGLDHPASSSSGIRHRSTTSPPATHESITQANAPIPTSPIPDYYFEALVENMEAGGVVSIGLAPEGTKVWGNNSYRYQANGKRSWFSSGARRQENYGTYYRAKSVIGCWWKINEKVIHFTKDGKDLGVAFRGVGPQAEKLVPTIGLGRGVRIKVNFGQEPFLFNVRSSEGEPGESEEARTKRLQEEENRIKKEREEEEARRKKEKENEEAARLEAAQPLLAMGYELKKALFAMQSTGYSGAEAAVMWLLENQDVNIPDDDKEKEKKEKEKEKETDKEKQEEKPEVKPNKGKEPATESVPMDISPTAPLLPEKNYNVASSSKYYLDDCFTYHDADETIPSKDGPPGASEWDDTVIPEIRTYMENDGFSNFEVEEYLCQIRNQLTQGNESQARSIVQQIMGDAAVNVRFPGARSSRTSTNATTAAAAANLAAPAVTPMRMEDVRNHMWVMVSETSQLQWVPPMDKTLGRVGVVKSVNHTEGCVMVQFYHPELAAAEEWWYPVRCLSRAHAHQPHSSLNTIASVIGSFAETESDLLSHYARRVILTLALHRGPAEQGPLHTKDVLTLAAAEHLALPLAKRPPLALVRDYLHKLITQQGPQQLLSLAEYASELLASDAQYVSGASVVATADSPPTTPLKVSIDNASTLVVLFDKQSSFPANNQAK
jgi:SPRY domain